MPPPTLPESGVPSPIVDLDQTKKSVLYPAVDRVAARVFDCFFMRCARTRRRYDTAIDRRAGRLRRGVSVWLGLLLLAFNLLAADMLAAPADAAAPSAQAPFAQALRGDRIIICTAAGLVVLDRGGHPVGGGNSAGHQGLCVFCLPLMQGIATAPPLLAVAASPPANPARAVAWTAALSPILPARPTGSVSSRGPPSLGPGFPARA
ncbi:hypothetical protein GALL_158620 [mine drainage metagenome]|uniref:DUF2946 domain-containing protein n=1 Tax=mine drainage metagenome TaxID=410659 RepID=A0A1J5SJW1_9ZZZZ